MSAPTDRAQTIAVLAKEPVPGRVKTRLQADFSPGEAAGLAACAIEDTLHALRASRAARKVLVWDGNPYPWSLEFETVGPNPSETSTSASAPPSTCCRTRIDRSQSC